MQGICCSCQCVVPVRSSSRGRLELLEIGQENEDIDLHYGESINYVCAEHNAFGPRCEGVGMVPQTVFS